MELWIGALVLGLIYSIMTIGVYISYKILDFADITVDGSFTLGAAVSAVLITLGVDPFTSLIFATLAGGLAGMLTGLIHTKMKVNGLLAGILVMIALYSINLHIMGRSNVPLLQQPNFMSFFLAFNPNLPEEIWLSICMLFVISAFACLTSLFFKTDLGLTLRATGDNSIMSSALGVNVDSIKIFGIALSNALVGLAGGAIAQYQGFADIGMGIGMVVNGLAAVIIGEALIKMPSIYAKISSAAIGSILFRFMIAFALFAGMNPIDLKLLTALFVLITIFISLSAGNKVRRKKFVLQKKRVIIGLVAVTAGAVAFVAVNQLFDMGSNKSPIPDGSRKRIGIVQVTSNGVLDITREALLKELEKIGYNTGNLEIIQKNANNDLANLNSIIDDFNTSKVDVIVTISTPATQAALSRAKNIPIVFATIANPFIIKAGTSDTEHLPNVTGTYGWAPMDKTMEFVTQILGDKFKIGIIWDVGQANAEFNVHNLKEELKKYPNIELFEANISSTTDIQQAAVSLISKGINAFVLPPDNTLYSALDAVLKASNNAKIPVFLNDVERLEDGALGSMGHDYTSSGQEAAHIVDRVLKGEKPANIPFFKYSKLTCGLNLNAAKYLGIKLDKEVVYKANYFVGTKKVQAKKKIGIVQFAMEPNVEICKEGLLNGLAGYGYKDGDNIEIIYKNANADFPMINAIMQDLIARDVDIIVPLSTPVVQSSVQQVGGRDNTSVVFTYIYDPYKIGAAKSSTDHLPNFTGVACFPPMKEMFDLIKEMYPEKKKVGVVWNSSEANSESVIKFIRGFVASKGMELIESTVTNPSEVLDASNALISKGAEIFLNAGDNTLNVAYDSFAKVAADNNIPLFSADAETIYNNTIATLGPDYYRTGFDGGVYLARILDGEKAAKIPIMQTKETLLYLNRDVAKRLNYKFANTLIKRASKIVIDSTLISPEKLSVNILKEISK
ncbi:MAG TPA: ABC transporter substrate binding protein [Candidatus Kapabacteria bacterium]|nr:ABC transporter substrate binding protein [Candidatus Kapabacteria bacterium]